MRGSIMLGVAAGVSFVTATAYGGDVGPNPRTDTVVGPNSSTGAAALHFESRDGLPTSIQTGFHGPSIARVNVGIKIDPVVNGGPLYAVDMPRGALVLASWADDKRIVLKALGGLSTDGQVAVRHTLTPSIDFDFSFVKFSLDATKLLNRIPGASVAFDSHASQAFSPWAFTAIDTKLTAPDLDHAELFSLGMDDLPEFVSNNIRGSFGVRATTEPSFSYRTTKIALQGTSGAIVDANGEVTMTAVDGDAMDLVATVDGEMTVTGAIAIQPFIRIDRIGSLPIPFDLGIDAFEQPYTVPPEVVTFPPAVVHVPLPNVHVPARAMSGVVTIENSGEKAATLTFQSSSSSFAVTGETITVGPKARYDLEIRSAANDANASGQIKVHSNDPDSPFQTIDVSGGASPGQTAGARDPASTGDTDSGCGCRTASSQPFGRSAAGFGLLASAVAAAVTRRRRRRAR